MKVVQIKLRTPGIFLGMPEPGIRVPELTLKIKDGDDWKPVEDIDNIKVLQENYLPSESYVTQELLVTSSVNVPLQGDRTKYYNLLVPDGESWEYRIEAVPCVDCVKVYRSYGRDEEILNGIGVIVASGSFSS